MPRSVDENVFCRGLRMSFRINIFKVAPFLGDIKTLALKALTVLKPGEKTT